MTDNYSNDYKHFDNLIWQLPGWSTGIFVLAIAGLGLLADSKFNNLNPNLSNTTIAAGFLIVCLFFQVAVFNALVRFRDHQFETRTDDFVFAKWWYSGQFWLQNAVIIQSGALTYLLLFITIEKIATTVAIVLMIVLFFYSLLTVFFKSR